MDQDVPKIEVQFKGDNIQGVVSTGISGVIREDGGDGGDGDKKKKEDPILLDKAPSIDGDGYGDENNGGSYDGANSTVGDT